MRSRPRCRSATGIDTAEMYPNERGVGQGIPDAGLDRAELYITSKLNNGCHRPDPTGIR
jgi:2,5-diketo-D-gluconate reductase A